MIGHVQGFVSNQMVARLGSQGMTADAAGVWRAR